MWRDETSPSGRVIELSRCYRARRQWLSVFSISRHRQCQHLSLNGVLPCNTFCFRFRNDLHSLSFSDCNGRVSGATRNNCQNLQVFPCLVNPLCRDIVKIIPCSSVKRIAIDAKLWCCIARIPLIHFRDRFTSTTWLIALMLWCMRFRVC